MDRGEVNGVISLDLRKAFDLISHECLLEKLRIYQCDDNSSKWFRSYLTGRTQQTLVKGHLSETASQSLSLYNYNQATPTPFAKQSTGDYTERSGTEAS